MNILVRGTNWVGDAVMTIPALRELRRIFPESRITLHTRSWARGIFQDAVFIDEIIAFERRKSAAATLIEQSRNLKKGKFDLAVLFPNSFESALAAKLGGIPERFGYAKDGRSFLLTEAVKIPAWKNQRHEIFYYLNLIAEVEKKYTGAQNALHGEPLFDLKVSNARKTNAREILTANNVDLSKKTVAFVVGSTNSRAKRWQAESYAKLNDKIQVELNANVVLIGAPEELEVSQKVFAAALRKPVILTGKTNLAQASAVLSVCDLLIANDTGPAHIAAALGTKTIVIFGPTNPLTTRPWNSEIIAENVECAPCMLRDCPIDHRCMTRISADEVFAKVRALLKDESGS